MFSFYFCSKHRSCVPTLSEAAPTIYVFEQKLENHVYPYKLYIKRMQGGINHTDVIS